MYIGMVYTRQGDFEDAFQIQSEAYEIARSLNSKELMAEALVGMADTYMEQGKKQDAINVLKEAELMAKDIEADELLKRAYEKLADNSADLSNYREAYIYQNLLTAVKDTLFNNANENRLNLMEATHQLGEKEKEVQLQELTIQKQRLVKNAFLIGLVLILIIAFIIFRNYLAKVKINKILDRQKEQIETLLLNILPKKVARELQEQGKATPRDYESVSVLFTDFKGFSSIAKTLDPNELVNELSSFFVAFDGIIEKYNLEKIKTIGDAYMCAGGIPTPNESHALDTVMAGLEMQKFMKENNEKRVAEGKIPWELRVGIHTGPIVAGVVGKKKYAYDIWGSTVNIASRMESNGEPGKVNVSQSTYCLINDKFTLTHRGKISAKNVGEVDMYFVGDQKN
jgi:class 3 adenylate cyclase